MIAILGIFTTTSGCGDAPVKTENAATPFVDDVATPVAFTVSGRPRITRQMHAHSPIFPGRGKETYRLRGTITFDGQSISIDVDAVPAALVKISRNYYLLTQGYFSPERFWWHAVNDGKIERIPLELLPRELWCVNFPEQESWRVNYPKRDSNWLYKIWVLRENLDNPQTVVQLFNQFVAEDPRCLLREFKAGMPARTALTDLLKKMDQSPDDYIAIIPSLWAMLHAATPVDDPQDIRFIGFAMLKINPEFARENLPKFFKDVKAQQIDGDHRRSGLYVVINVIHGRKDVHKEYDD